MSQIVLHLLPFSGVRGIVVPDESSVFLSYLQPWRLLIDTLYHELAHLLTGCMKHTRKWLGTYQQLGGSVRGDLDAAGDIQKMFAADAAYLNIGNISGVQNMLLDVRPTGR